MSRAAPPASRTAAGIATELAALSASIAVLSEILRRGEPPEVRGVAQQVSAICAALLATPRDEELARQMFGLSEQLQRLVSDAEVALRDIHHHLDSGNRRLVAARAYQPGTEARR